MSFKNLNTIQSLYFLPEDNIIGDIYIPALRDSIIYDSMFGFFSSDAIKEIAPGLAEFLSKDKTQMRLLISPHLSKKDQDALISGYTNEEDLLEKRIKELLGEISINENALKKYTLECISYMIARKKLNIRIVLVREGLFHPKVKIFSDGENIIACHGSSNLTIPGLKTNIEQISVTTSWHDSKDLNVVLKLQNRFDLIWNNKNQRYLKTFNLPEAVKQNIIENFATNNIPTSEEYWRAVEKDRKAMDMVVNIPLQVEDFKIPEDINYVSGDFSHQGDAIEAWEFNGRKGILQMATGSGKTYTSLIAANRLYKKLGNLFIIIAVPYLPLVSQWGKIVHDFGINPIIPSNASTKKAKLAKIQKCLRKLNLNISKIEVLIITHNLLSDENFLRLLSKCTISKLLIADEVHNLGTKKFLSNLPTDIEYRLGLSATPIRQYDEQGTEELLKFFGEIVFQFGLKEAIGKCLVPYYYYVHVVHLTQKELEEWLDISERLRILGWKIHYQAETIEELPKEIQRLLNQRRKILEQAEEKLIILPTILKKLNLHEIKHTLVYASDKGRQQLKKLNEILMDELKLKIHQITQEETSSPALMKSLLEEFSKGVTIQVLTAMRVLDEGIDIPEISTAFILSSTTVERQWIQRRGRVLRKSKKTNKKHAYIHDFLVLPPRSTVLNEIIKDLRALLKSEINRIMSFAELSINAAEKNGALSVVNNIIEEYY